MGAVQPARCRRGERTPDAGAYRASDPMTVLASRISVEHGALGRPTASQAFGAARVSKGDCLSQHFVTDNHSSVNCHPTGWPSLVDRPFGDVSRMPYGWRRELGQPDET